MKSRPGYASIDEYIGTFPRPVQEKLTTLRQLIRRTAPGATEKISYQMPTFYLNGNLVHFAAHARHIGFYPTPSGISKFKTELSKYQSSKGSVQFPMEESLPVELIEKIVKFRVGENTKKGQGSRAYPTLRT
jgi:uncharacterized protein YdhG (YjbR/CyaY superfamily)